MARRRVCGPYKHGQRWRTVFINEFGAQTLHSFDTKEEADDDIKEQRKFIEEDEGVTVAQALDKYEVAKGQLGNKQTSIATTRYRVTRLLGDDLGRPLASIKENRAMKLYADLQPKVSVDYHIGALNETRTFFKWCMAKPRRWIKRNPFAGVEGEGKRRKGKPQHRVDEARKFETACFALHAKGDIAGTVGVAALYFGARITELVSRPIRDLDDDGWLLWIPDSKTEAGRRTLDVPEVLRTLLLQLADGRQVDEPLFKGPRNGKSITRYTAYDMVKRVCRIAGVPEVTPQGLRCTHSSLARESGATPNVVASALGHTSYNGVTAKNYVAPGTDARVRQRTVMGVLQGGRR